ncbi:MAG: extracellular solute-binding protein, partial [Chloroflexi bacterium]|nr:extracellular solute-binding protein [Chloroflexota bacterium]
MEGVLTMVTRRDFLKYVAATSVGMVIASCAPKPAPAPKEAEPTKPAAAPTQPPAKAPAAQIEIRYMERGDPLGDFMRHASRLYEERNPNIKIINEPAGWGDLTTKVPTYVAAGTMADVAFQHGALMLPELAAKGAWLNLEPLAERDKHDFSIYYKWAIDTLRQGPKGELVAMPQGVHLGQNELHWNKEMLQKFGIPEPHDQMKIAELNEFFIKVQEKMPENAFATHWPSGLWTNECVSRSFGGYIISQDRKKCGFALPKTQDGHKWVYDLVNTHKVMPKQDQILKNATSMFYTEMLATAFNCAANIWVGFTEAVAGKFTLGHCTWPRGDTGWGVTPSCDATVIYSKTKYPEE